MQQGGGGRSSGLVELASGIDALYCSGHADVPASFLRGLDLAREEAQITGKEALHSVSENLDLSSAAGRMFYNILGTFAQFFREQLSENVKMGNERAVREGKWLNRAKTGYDSVDGELVPNEEAPRVREIFRLRADGKSYREIENRTGIRYSTVSSILASRLYLGEVTLKGSWYRGRHEALVTEAEWNAAARGHGQTSCRDG